MGKAACTSNLHTRTLAGCKSTIRFATSSSSTVAQARLWNPHRPILRANPFPEDTDLICRIPLSTLFYRPEAVNLGDLMRLWVRSGVKRARRQIFKGRHERT